MVIEAILDVLVFLAVEPLTLLPEYVTPEWLDDFHLTGEPFFNNANALLPIGPGLEFLGFCLYAAVILLPFMTVVWLWGAIRP